MSRPDSNGASAASAEESGPPARGRREILAGGLWMAASVVVPFVATAALSVVAGRLLGAELLGRQSLIAFSGALLSALVLSSLTDASISSLAALRGGKPALVPALARWTWRTHIVAGGVAAVTVLGVGLADGRNLSAWFVMSAALLLDAVAWGWSAQVVARDGWGPVARRRLVTQLLAAVFGVAAVFGGLGITGIFLGSLAASVVLLVLLRPLIPRDPVPGERVPVRPVLLMWSSFALGAALTQIVSGRIEILVLGAFRSGAEIAQYTLAVMLVTSAIMLPTALASGAMPEVAVASGAGDQQRADAAFTAALRVTAALSLPLTAVLVAVGPAFVTGLYGADFAEAGRLSRWVAFGAFLIPCGRLATAYWAGLGTLRLPLIGGALGAVLELSLAFALVPAHGAQGAVVATLVGQGSASCILVLLTLRALSIRHFIARGWVAALCASTLAGSAGIVAAGVGGLPGALLGGAATVATFVVVATVLGAFGAPLLDQADAAWLRATLPDSLAPLVRPLTGP